jgi:DMSO/TMAO reductase YedYZ molybdopterin-dependent catalytic subunit
MIERMLGGPRLSDEQRARVPPGQYVTEKWPVLHYGSVPRSDPSTWDFRVWGEVEEPFSFGWEEFRAMPRKSVHTDVHCVTRWSRLDMEFSGVPIQHILERAKLKPTARFVLAHAEQGYTTNLPLEVLDDDDVLLADEADGHPLAPEHGSPLRLVVPKRYFWKSAKWIRSLQFLARDEPGFWERYGYHNDADPWQEQRFSDD